MNKVTLGWVPVHDGIQGNEKAYTLAQICTETFLCKESAWLGGALSDAAPIWQRAMEHNQSRKKLEQTQRRVALRVCSAYRTVSTEAALVISGTVPIKLQVLSGHGCFGYYKRSFALSDTDACAYCGECDITLHTVFACPRWSYQRKGVEENLGRALTVESMVALMVESEDNWRTVADYLGVVMRRKEEDERHVNLRAEIRRSLRQRR
ncbi:uncharacterized protein LOC124369698 [Homalodisca vitripennis]|uniref:uncharacterized protein LOC124369698 n=1 Tax=Homalodisca vitripennis TaxID=197043 RepID=UPI001EEB6B91|nr:uncharacterized protein LOC124369698 [Homalodisca vitripennis]